MEAYFVDYFLTLGNFKAFGRKQKIALKPITLVFGPNSAGKSSIIQSLLLARQALADGNLDVYNAGGSMVDLGGFRQYIHKREASREVNWGFLSKQRGIQLTIGMVRNNLSNLGESLPVVTTCSVLYKEKVLATFERKDNNFLYLTNIDTSVLLKICSINNGEQKKEELNNEIERYIDAIVVNCDKFLPKQMSIDLRKLPDNLLPKDYKIRDNDEDSVVPIRLFLHSPMFPFGSGENYQAIFKVLERLDSYITSTTIFTISKYLNKIFYLGPLRAYPPRYIAYSQPYDSNWLAMGGEAWEIIRRDVVVRNKVNNWLCGREKLQTPYMFKVRQLVDREVVSKLNSNYELKKWLEQLDETTRIEADPDSIFEMDTVNELILIDGRTDTVVSPCDVGTGISQIIPVLVAAYAFQSNNIAIEQPEIHLHPAIQAELADVFLISALGEQKNTFILETHSEHLILRIMRRMRETYEGRLPEGFPNVRPQDISILYVQPRESNSVVKTLELDEEGRLLDAWPGGFFEESFRERFDI